LSGRLKGRRKQMKNQGLKELVGSIFTDGTVRSQFAKDPLSVIAKFDLTLAEKRTVLSPKIKVALSTGDTTVLSEFDLFGSWF
jgi:hypothetical protein